VINSQPSTKDQHYKRNVFGISSVEFIWGLGLPVVIESTFLQLFVKSMGGSSFAIGLIPTFFFVGISFFTIFSSYLTSGLKFKKTIVIVLHLITGLSMLLFGSFLYYFGQTDQILVIFFVSYGIFSLSLGFTLPVWLNYLVDIFSEEKSVSGIAYMNIAQNCAKLIGSLVLVKVVSDYAFSIRSSALVFIGVGALFALGSFFFLITREIPEKNFEQKKNASFMRHTLESFRHMFNNRNYLTFLAGDFQFYILVTVVSFYAAYATSFCGIEKAVAAGFFVACIYTGAIIANFVLGTRGWLSLKKKHLFSICSSFTAVIILIIFSSQWTFFVASFLMGASRGARMVSMAPTTKKLSGLADSTSYFAISPLVTLPLASGLPMIAGTFLDRFSFLGADAYRILFSFCALLILGTFFFMLKTDFSGLAVPGSDNAD
jgi:MFS family permease